MHKNSLLRWNKGAKKRRIINKSVSQFAVLKYLAGQSFPGLYCWGGGRFAVNTTQGNWKCLVHLCPPASVDERADGLIRPRSTGVEMGAVPRLNQTHKVGTLTLDQQTESKHQYPVLKDDFFFKSEAVNTRSHLFTLSCHLTFSLSLGRGWPVDLHREHPPKKKKQSTAIDCWA